MTGTVAAYFIVIGPDDDELHPIEFDSNGNAFMAGPLSLETPFHAFVTDRYPGEDRPDDPLPEGIQLFCLPRGVQLMSAPKRPSLHTFVQTNAIGEHLLGCCMTFYEPITAAQRASLTALLASQSIAVPEHMYVPRCLCLVSRNCFPSAFKKVLCGLYYQHTLTSAVPLERHVCNLIDDVPHPLSVRLDVSFYMNEQPIMFKCPLPEEPPAWSGMPLFPLFECLPLAKVLELFTLVLCERQVVFISQQCSLLTACAQAVTSLLFPLSWPHAFIPVLPRQLVGVLEAPHPFICGVPAAYLQDCPMQEESVKVYLDLGRLEMGSEGPAPALPESLKKRLLQHLGACAPIFDKRPTNWKTHRLPLFDDAFCSLTDHSSRQIAVPVRKRQARRLPPGKLVSASHGSSTLCHERKVRAGFLNFFVALLHDYRRFLIYGTALAPDPPVKFRFDDFAKAQPPEHRPLLAVMLHTQAFSQFLDERVLTGRRDTDVVFFDDAIDARTARARVVSASRALVRETSPLGSSVGILRMQAVGSSRTFVAPSPDITGLPRADAASWSEPGGDDTGCTYSYARFPHLSASLYAAPRTQTQSSLLHSDGQVADALAPLKRTTVEAGPHFPSELACVFSCYLVTACLVVSSAYKQQASRRLGSTTNQVIADYAPIPQQPERLAAIDATPNAEFHAMPMVPNHAQGAEEMGLEVRAGTGEEAQAIALLLAEEDEEPDGDRNELDLIGLDESFISEPDTNIGAVPAESSIGDLEALTLVDTEAPTGSYLVSLTDQRQQLLETAAPKTLAPRSTTESIASTGGSAGPREGRARADSTAYWRERDEAAGAAARLGLRVAMEALNCLLRHGDIPDDAAFRCLVDACGVCGDAASAVDLLALLQEEGMQPDVGMLRSAARAASSEAALLTLTSHIVPNPAMPYPDEPILRASEVWTTQDWRPVQLRRGVGAVSCLFSRRTRSYAVLPYPSPPHAVNTAAARPPAPTDPSAHLALNIPSSTATGSSPGGKSPIKRNGAASAKLSRQMSAAEALLESTFPGLHVDLSNALGTQCPRSACPAQRPLSASEIARGWIPGDSNGYATACVHCGTKFVPRFAVTCALPNFCGSDGPGTPLWCELLSPWTLRKELLKVVLEGGVAALGSSEFRDATHSERAVLFWNAIVAFRARGLPFSFLLCEADISTAFPPPPRKSNNTSMPSLQLLSSAPSP